MSNEYGDKAVIGKLDVDNNPNVSVEFGIRSIPTMLFFKNGQVVDRVVGVASKTALAQKLNALL
jgi:thioredoxin 1